MMEGVAEKKREVEEKLRQVMIVLRGWLLSIFSVGFAVRQDEKVVGVLRESLEKSNNVTSGMVSYFEAEIIR